MATMNLLSASVNGKLGTAYGVKQRGQYILKAVPFSHSPHNTAQKQSFRAFGCLQRFSAQWAKAFWRYLSLSDKRLQRINAVAAWLTPIMTDKTFSIPKITNIIPEKADAEIISAEYDAKRNLFFMQYSYSLPNLNQSDYQFLIGAWGVGGKGYGTIIAKQTDGKIAIPTNFDRDESIYLIITLAIKQNGKWIIHSQKNTFINFDVFQNEIWYIGNMKNGSWRFRDPEELTGRNVQYEYDGETLTMPKSAVII